MPKSPEMRPGLVGWAFLAVLLAVAAYFAVTAPMVVASMLGLFALAAMLAYLRMKRERAGLLRLASQRPGQSICEFARDFDARVVDTWIIRAVHEELQRQLAHIHPAFPVRADDDLKADLRLDDDDLDMDLAPTIAQRTGRSLDLAESNPHYERVKTVRDLVMFFQAQPVKP